ncbi:LRR receptor-like serine/threonine-protein kinase FLS2 [Phalaenopsis equestris]|uniref:LRR receptor-like serine/threonine-protein kinase FLS2 n=1 Tax=Phalaenopsis equestris TaxID=78828 RepID=UPI0009E4724F|nr:LRR receptor-like serine/threonine-protein kinase FLS2 [Phalaenopsis equestris]
MEIKQSLSGQPISHRNLAARNYCRISGITCDDDCHHNVVEIGLSSMSLTDTIPSTLYLSLPMLRVLRLGFDNLHGDLHVDLLNCSHLQELNLTNSGIGGTIPNISSLYTLRVLKLSAIAFVWQFACWSDSDNHWKDEEPLAFGALLQFFEDEIPKELGNLPKLMHIDLSGNKLTGIVLVSLCLLQKLKNFFSLRTSSHIEKVLRVEGAGDFRESIPCFNQFEEIVKNSIGNAKNLTSLILQSNQFSRDISFVISEANKLVRIDLGNSLFSGSIPSKIRYLRKLSQLSLQGNMLGSTIPESISNLKSLNVLNLSNNLLTKEIPNSICSLLPISLGFSNNHLFGPILVPFIKEGLIESIYVNPNLCILIHLNIPSRLFPFVHSQKSVG